jgi:acyl-CoA thioesterase-1
MASSKRKLVLRIAVLVAWSLGSLIEFPHHLVPALPRLGNPAVIVVGDSISAGMGGEAARWPEILARRHHVEVNNLSLAGSDVAGALQQQAGRVVGSGSLVLAEIGGNDVLGENSPEAFERGLDALLGRLREGGRTVVLLELPLPPFHNRYGAAQRRSAGRHGVLLVPRRFLLGALMSGGATLDTIHLSGPGHSLMAERMWGLIRPAFEP